MRAKMSCVWKSVEMDLEKGIRKLKLMIRSDAEKQLCLVGPPQSIDRDGIGQNQSPS